jgi:ribose-phosphate pyrophosphokinase
MKQEISNSLPISVYVDNKEAKVLVSNYPDGTTNYTLLLDSIGEYSPESKVRVEVDSFWGMSKDGYLWELNCLADILAEHFLKATISFYYLPHGRADRAFDKYGCVPLRVFFRHLSTFYKRVLVNDVHNYAALSEFCNREIEHVQMFDCINMLPIDIEDNYDILVSPDTGALGKVLAAGVAFNKNVVMFSKQRTDAGITITPPDNIGVVKGKRVLICDDICDGGGTFLAIGEALKNAGAKVVDLYVTHGIFSKGFEVFTNKIDSVYYYNRVGYKR